MKTLDKRYAKELEPIIKELKDAGSELETEISKFNDAIVEHRETIEAIAARYNAAIADAQTLQKEAQADVQSYFDDRSEKWQEGERGQEYQTWIDEFDQLDLSEIEVDTPEAIEVPEMGAAESLEQDWPDSFSG